MQSKLHYAILAVAILFVGSFAYSQNPFMDIRVRSWGATGVSNSAALSDAMTNTTSPVIGSAQLGWDGTTLERVKTASLANMPIYSSFTSSTEQGYSLAMKPAQWVKSSAPAVSTQASASIAAEASVRHIVDTVCFSAGSTTAPVLTALTVNLRDGATGAGTVVMSWTVIVPAATGQNVLPICFTGLNAAMTTNTATTVEFSALLTNLFENVTMTGINVF